MRYLIRINGDLIRTDFPTKQKADLAAVQRYADMDNTVTVEETPGGSSKIVSKWEKGNRIK